MITKALMTANPNVLSTPTYPNPRRTGASDSASTTTNTTSSSPNSSGSERNLFMTLLVAQLKNQDPLAPQDGTAFVGQLAQFNSLDQLVGIRESIEQLTIQLQQATQNHTNQEAV